MNDGNTSRPQGVHFHFEPQVGRSILVCKHSLLLFPVTPAMVMSFQHENLQARYTGSIDRAKHVGEPN